MLLCNKKIKWLLLHGQAVGSVGPENASPSSLDTIPATLDMNDKNGVEPEATCVFCDLLSFSFILYMPSHSNTFEAAGTALPESTPTAPSISPTEPADDDDANHVHSDGYDGQPGDFAPADSDDDVPYLMLHVTFKWPKVFPNIFTSKILFAFLLRGWV